MCAREKNEYATSSKTNMPQHLKRCCFLPKNSIVLDAKWLCFRCQVASNCAESSFECFEDKQSLRILLMINSYKARGSSACPQRPHNPLGKTFRRKWYSDPEKMAGRLIGRGISTLSRPAIFYGSEYYFPQKSLCSEQTIL